MALNIVPITTMPQVPEYHHYQKRRQLEDPVERYRRSRIRGSEISSTTSSRTRFDRAFPVKSAEPGVGEDTSASRQSLISSRAKLRFRISAPANANTIPAVRRRSVESSSDVGSNAKLNSSRMTKRERTPTRSELPGADLGAADP